MAAIGQLTFIGWQGRLYPAEPEYELTKRQGLDGYGIIYDAWRAEPAEISTREDLASSAVTNRIESYRRLVTTTVQVIDGMGFTWPNCIVVACRVPEPSQNLDGSYRLTSSWLLLPPALRPL